MSPVARVVGRLAAALAVVLAVAAPAAAAPLAAPAAVQVAAPAAVQLAAAPVPAATGSGVQVQLEELGPTALVPGSQLSVRVRVTNRSGVLLSGARARLFVDSPVLADRAAVTAWAAGEGVQGGDRFAGVSGAEQALSGSLAPGASTEVQFTVDADELRLGDDFGPRGVTVDVLDTQLQRLTALRTFLVWVPQGSPPAAAGLTVLAPVTAGALDVGTAQLPETSVDAQTGPDGRLSRLLLATATPSATLLVDPAVTGPFAQAPQDAATGSPSAGGAPSAQASASPSGTATSPTAGTTELAEGTDAETSAATQSWLSQLAARTAGGAVVLPQGDPDVQATVAAGTADLLPLAVGQAAATATERAGAEPAAVVVLPADSGAAPGPLVLAASRAGAAAAAATPTATAGASGSATASTSASGSPTASATASSTTSSTASATAGGTASSAADPVVVVDSSTVAQAAAAAGLGATPTTANLTTTAADGTAVDARAVLADGTDSALLAASTTAAGSSTAVQDAPSPAETGARLLADTAVAAAAAAAGAPGSGLVLSLPRTWDPDPSAVSAALGAVGSAPWVRSAPLGDLLAAAGQAPSLAVDPSAAVDPSGTVLPADGLQAAEAAIGTASSVADLVADRSALLDPVRRSAVAAASLGWRSQQDAWRVELAALSTEAQGLGGAVAVVPGGAPYVISRRVNLPVTVRNSLAQEVVVTVQLRSNSYRLVAGPAQDVRIPAGSQVPIQLPVRVVASGDTSLSVLLSSPVDGHPVGEPAALRVRVRADWEGRGVAVAAGVAVLVLVGGVVRTVVRVRRRPPSPVVRSAEQADGDAPPRPPQPLQPAAREGRPQPSDPEEPDRG